MTESRNFFFHVGRLCHDIVQTSSSESELHRQPRHLAWRSASRAQSPRCHHPDRPIECFHTTHPDDSLLSQQLFGCKFLLLARPLAPWSFLFVLTLLFFSLLCNTADGLLVVQAVYSCKRNETQSDGSTNVRVRERGVKRIEELQTSRKMLGRVRCGFTIGVNGDRIAEYDLTRVHKCQA